MLSTVERATGDATGAAFGSWPVITSVCLSERFSIRSCAKACTAVVVRPNSVTQTCWRGAPKASVPATAFKVSTMPLMYVLTAYSGVVLYHCSDSA